MSLNPLDMLIIIALIYNLNLLNIQGYGPREGFEFIFLNIHFHIICAFAVPPCIVIFSSWQFLSLFRSSMVKQFFFFFSLKTLFYQGFCVSQSCRPILLLWIWQKYYTNSLFLYISS